MEGRERCAILLDEATVFESVGGTDLAGSVLGGLSVRHGGCLGGRSGSRKMSSDGFCACRSYAGGGGVVEGRIDGFEGGGRQISSGGVRVRPHQIVHAQACAADRAVRN